MSKRLQVVLDDSEYRELQKLARKHHMTVSEWVRNALRAMRRREPAQDAGRKLSAVREATRHAYPTGDIDQLLSEIERGYLHTRGS
jgi:predicted transcriptional regulator